MIASFYKLFIGKFQFIDFDSTSDAERGRLHLEWVERERVAQEEHLQRILHPASFSRFSRKQMRVATPRISFPQPNFKSFQYPFQSPSFVCERCCSLVPHHHTDLLVPLTAASTPVRQRFRRPSRKP